MTLGIDIPFCWEAWESSGFSDLSDHYTDKNLVNAHFKNFLLGRRIAMAAV
ncbi:hypothetical protein [Corynebacterium silvaticum]|uniref:hypothetical protein n=1 Tax=Corynebacterium silvaticum TaxID=2320431 RepID=UPI0019D56558|nr:hypothetical protein [Corynebacterium silvaticum]